MSMVSKFVVVSVERLSKVIDGNIIVTEFEVSCSKAIECGTVVWVDLNSLLEVSKGLFVSDLAEVFDA